MVILKGDYKWIWLLNKQFLYWETISMGTPGHNQIEAGYVDSSPPHFPTLVTSWGHFIFHNLLKIISPILHLSFVKKLRTKVFCDGSVLALYFWLYLIIHQAQKKKSKLWITRNKFKDPFWLYWIVTALVPLVYSKCYIIKAYLKISQNAFLK